MRHGRELGHECSTPRSHGLESLGRSESLLVQVQPSCELDLDGVDLLRRKAVVLRRVPAGVRIVVPQHPSLRARQRLDRVEKPLVGRGHSARSWDDVCTVPSHTAARTDGSIHARHRMRRHHNGYSETLPLALYDCCESCVVRAPHLIQAIAQLQATQLAREGRLPLARRTPNEPVLHVDVGARTLDDVVIDVAFRPIEVNHVPRCPGHEKRRPLGGRLIVERVDVEIASRPSARAGAIMGSRNWGGTSMPECGISTTIGDSGPTGSNISKSGRIPCQVSTVVTLRERLGGAYARGWDLSNARRTSS